MRKQSTLIVDNDQRGGAVVQDFPELALLLNDLRFALGQRTDIVDPAKSLAAGEADMPASIRDLNVGDKQVNELTALAAPDHLLVQKLSPLVPQSMDNSRSLIAVVPEETGVD